MCYNQADNLDFFGSLNDQMDGKGITLKANLTLS